LILVENIHKKYGSLEVLKGIDLQIEKSEIISIVGASGAGKTTLLQILGTIEKPSMGRVISDGIDLFNLSDKKLADFRNNHIGFIFQFHQLLAEFTAVENVMLPALINGKSSSEAKSKAMDLLGFLNIEDKANKKPDTMSGGENQRVAVARALINRPKIVLADEPSGNLDSKNAKELQALFLRLRDEFHQAFVIVTHNIDLANTADRKLTIKDGKISK